MTHILNKYHVTGYEFLRLTYKYTNIAKSFMCTKGVVRLTTETNARLEHEAHM
jgi:hypothetical protein